MTPIPTKCTRPVPRASPGTRHPRRDSPRTLRSHYISRRRRVRARPDRPGDPGSTLPLYTARKVWPQMETPAGTARCSSFRARRRGRAITPRLSTRRHWATVGDLVDKGLLNDSRDLAEETTTIPPGPFVPRPADGARRPGPNGGGSHLGHARLTPPPLGVRRTPPNVIEPQAPQDPCRRSVTSRAGRSDPCATCRRSATTHAGQPG